tara:strand:+ start:850 stop:2193 length:1344 start_codon:yes stop_codon:yes gene_type:complete
MFNNLRPAYAASVDVQKVGRKFGSSLFTGTGGDMEGTGTLDAAYMFYNPKEFDLLEFVDIWEGLGKSGKVAYFIPANFANEMFKNEDLRSTPELLEKGLKYYEGERDKFRSGKGDSISLDNFIVYHPIKPSEVFLTKSGNIFPVAELQMRLNVVRSSDADTLINKKVELYFNPNSDEAINGVHYKLDIENKLQAIDNFPYNKPNKEGAVMIYELPRMDEGKVPKGLYLIGHDPIAGDGTEGSFASIYVLKTKKYPMIHGHDEIVAQYVGRPFQGRKIINEILYKLSLLYGDAKIYFENVRGNTKEYFEKVGRLDLLAKQPTTVLTKKSSAASGAPQIYGYPMSNQKMKIEALQYLRDWLLEERGKNGKGFSIRNLDTIWDQALLQELIQFNLDGNFDRVMGIAGAIVGLEETHNQYKENLFNRKKERVDNLAFLTGNKSVFKSYLNI